MGIAPTPILVSSYGTGNSLDGQITRDPIDDLVAGMSSHLLIYLLAKKIPPGTTPFVDRLGNTINQSTSHATKTASDPNFGNHPSITLSFSDDPPYWTAAGGIGISTLPIAMSNSFTILTGVRVAAITNNGGLYGDGTSSNGGVQLGMGTTGNFFADINGTREVNASNFFTANTTYALFYSYDATTKIHRYGINNASSYTQVQGSMTRTSQGTSTVCYPFSQYSGSAESQFIWNRWMLFNKAYLNGAIPSDDATFVNLVSSYTSYL
ncbi:MAG TPA: hypothetical protein VHU23_16745 [Rhizomicrobium sp.]|jgi:hypothetical protein|nr:hypothetical protein [Rhizomicrobium sp.]